MRICFVQELVADGELEDREEVDPDGHLFLSIRTKFNRFCQYHGG
jgi:hypothetical protein